MFPLVPYKLDPRSFNSVPSSLSDSGQYSEYTAAALDSALMYIDGPNGGHMSDGGVAALLDEYFLANENTYDSRMEPEQDHGPPLSTCSFDSVVSDSTFTSGLTWNTSTDQGEDSAEYLENIFEGISPLAPELLWAYEDQYSSMNGAFHCQTHESNGSFNVEGSVTNPEINVVLSEVIRSSARTWPGLVRVVCACHRFRSEVKILNQTDRLKLGVTSKNTVNSKRKRSVESNKHKCEIRISKKIPRDGKYSKEKVWLGTYATAAKAGRALDVGKYFLSAEKKRKNFSDPNSEAILSAFKDHLNAQPLTELVRNVTKIAKYYGENGSLPHCLDIL